METIPQDVRNTNEKFLVKIQLEVPLKNRCNDSCRVFVVFLKIVEGTTANKANKISIKSINDDELLAIGHTQTCGVPVKRFKLKEFDPVEIEWGMNDIIEWMAIKL